MRSHAICIALVLALTSAASAQTAAPSTCNRTPHANAGMRTATSQLMAARQTMKQACAADMATYCADVPKGCGQEKQCMKAHASQLSSSCASAMQNMRAARRGA